MYTCIYIYIYTFKLKLLTISSRMLKICSIERNTIIKVTNNNKIPLHCASWWLPNDQMVYNICFIPKTKETYIYKQYHENNILSVL